MNVALLSTFNIVIGALLGFGATFLTQRFTERRALAREERGLQRERLETILRCIFSDTDWISERLHCVVYKKELAFKQRPLDEAHTIQSLYYPDLDDDILAIMQSAIALIDCIENQKPIVAAGRSWEHEKFGELMRVHLGNTYALTTKLRAKLNADKK
jgi:hypothetical protein